MPLVVEGLFTLTGRLYQLKSHALAFTVTPEHARDGGMAGKLMIGVTSLEIANATVTTRTAEMWNLTNDTQI